MTRRTLKHWVSRVTTSAALVSQAAVPAFADPPTASQHQPPETLSRLAGILDRPGSWFGPSFHIQKKAGFAYTHHFALSDRPLIFRIQGPVMRKQKALGLTFKIRF
jgi:hypothetical protein